MNKYLIIGIIGSAILYKKFKKSSPKNEGKDFDMPRLDDELPDNLSALYILQNEALDSGDMGFYMKINEKIMKIKGM